MKKQGLILVLMLMTIILITFGNSEVYAACSACDVGTAASCRNCTKGSWGTSGSMHNLECCCGRVYIRSHSASWGTYTVTKEATCSASGSKEATCTKCTLKTTSTINALSHDNYNKYVSTGSYGHMIYVTCRNCGHVSSTSSGPVAHSGGTATCTSGGSCTYCDEVYLSKLGHTGGSWKSEGYGTSKRHYKTCTRTGCGTNYNYGYHSYSTEYGSGDNCYRYTCNGCSGTSHSSWYGHTGGTATCIEKALCSKCNERYGSINASNHASTQTTTTHPQNDDSTHYEVVTHNCCGAEKSRTTKAHSWNTNHKCTICNYQGTHSWSGWTVTTAETCSAKGSEKRTCGCGALQTQDRAIDPNKHNYTIKCDKCGTTNVICSYNNAHIKSHLCDTVAPTVTVSNITYTQDATIKLKDTQSGIRYWGVTKNTTAPGSTGSADTTKGNTLAVWYPIANTTSEVSVTFSGLPAGTYYAWGKDLAGNSQRVEFKVSKLSLTIPTQKGTLTYNGKAQSPSWNDKNDTYMTLGGTTSKTNAGTYNATFTLKDSANTQWANGQITAQTAPWTIKKATPGAITLNPTSLTFTYTDAAKTVGVTRSGDGKVSAKSSKTTVATVSVSGTTITVTPIVVGESTITVSVAEGTNYLAATDVTFNVKVNKLSLTVPTQKGTLTYNGKAQSPSWNDKNDTYMTLGGTTSKTNAGTYDATFTLKDTANTQWANGQITTQTVPWTIKKATPGAITLNPTSLTFTYTDAAKTVAVTRTGDGKVSAKSSKTTVATVSVSGTTITVTPGVVGESTITVSVAEGTNYLAATDVTFNVKVNKLNLTVPTQKGTLTYNGKAQSPSWNDKNDTYMTLGGTTSKTNAGTYNATFTLKDTANTQWANGQITPQTVPWTIKKATPEAITLNPTSLTFTYTDAAKTVAVTRTGDGKVSAKSSKTTVATVSVSGTTITVTPGVVGESTITVSVAEGTNYLAATDVTFNVKVNKLSLTIPTQSGNIVYDGNKHSPTWKDKNDAYMTLGGTTSATNAGTYNATFTLRDTANTQWSDKKIEVKTVQWKIDRKPISIPVVTNKIYNYATQTALASGTGYTRSGTYEAKNVGKYNTTATLDSNHIWSDNTTEPKTYTWSMLDVVMGTIKGPDAVQKKEKETATFKVEETQGTNKKYQWYYNTSNSTTGGTKINNATSAEYSVVVDRTMNNRYYYCIISNNSESATEATYKPSGTALLTVWWTHEISSHPKDVNVKKGETATFKVVAIDGNPSTYTYQWYSVASATGGTPTKLNGETSDTYSYKPTQNISGMWYYCETSNGQYLVTSNRAKLVADITVPTINAGVPSVTHANKNVTFTIPIKVSDTGEGFNTNSFVASDIIVKVDGTNVSPTVKTLEYKNQSGNDYNYVLTLKGITGDGLLTLDVDAGTIADNFGNINDDTSMLISGITIDNISPVISSNGEVTGTNQGYINSEDTIAVPVKIIDVGGMNPSEFTASDIVVLVGGVPDPNAQVTVSYSGKTGSEYAYVITITNINGNGEMMLEIDKEKVYDYATNSNIKTTISGLNVIIDNIKPVVNDIVLSLDGYENSSKLYPESLPSYNESWINEEVYSVIKSSDESSGVETYWHSVGDESNFSAIPTDREIWSDEMDERDKVFYRVIDRAGNISDSVGVIIKIDKTGPIAADLDMRQNRENGIIYEYEVDNPTSKTIFIKPKNTVDTGVYQSGVLKSEYIVTFNNGVTTTTSEVIDGNTGTLLKETGTYIIEIITTDKAGNTSNKFINAAIDKQTENTIKINNIHDDGSGVTKVTITARKQGASTDAIEPIIIENPGSNITQRIKLSDGTFVITVKIEDGVGLVKELQQTITNEL